MPIDAILWLIIIPTATTAWNWYALLLSKPTRTRKYYWQQYNRDLIGVIPYSILYGAIFLGIERGIIFVLHYVGIAITWLFSSGHFLVSLSGIAVAGMLFVLRENRRRLYGFLEILVSIVGFSNYPMPPPFSRETDPLKITGWVLGIMTLVYVAVRGMDNFKQGTIIAAHKQRAEAERIAREGNQEVPRGAPVDGRATSRAKSDKQNPR